MSGMEAQVAVSKVGKYATSESGDTLEMIERPSGGLSFVLADGQRSGKPAKHISNIVARKAISLLAEGVRDGAAARAASDYLFTHRSGKVVSTLNILSIDLSSRTLVITRNNPSPLVIVHNQTIKLVDDPVDPVGIRRDIRPSIHEIPLETNLAVVIFSDGLTNAGDRYGQPMQPGAMIEVLLMEKPFDARVWADALLEHAVDLDQGRPNDDISVLVAMIHPRTNDDVRRLWARMPL
ncbi:MAG: serine/threonine-protein phosphatase [Anaerolineales bacterium]|nr:MAG: serine/threonine-protein phosphatase [Anaerolineales bacterium]